MEKTADVSLLRAEANARARAAAEEKLEREQVVRALDSAKQQIRSQVRAHAAFCQAYIIQVHSIHLAELIAAARGWQQLTRSSRSSTHLDSYIPAFMCRIPMCFWQCHA
jgi:hypothetical protein